MATLTLPITDALAHQLPASVEILKKESPLSPQADGASFYNPEDSPSQGKYVPQKESISTPSTTKVEAPASSTPYTSVQNPLRTASVPKDVTDPLAFIDTYLNVAPKWSSESELEREILRQQISKREQIVHQKQRDSDVAIALEARIRNREAQLGALQAEMKRKVKHIDSKKEALEQFRVDFADAVKQQMQDASSSTVQKSSQTRMREEQEKKRLLSEWKTSNSDDQIQSVRRTILVSQDEVSDLNIRIVNLKKELELLHHMASKEISSKFIMLEQREKRKQMTPREHEPTAPKVYAPPPAPIVRSHLSRMAEAKENKERARAARLAAGSVPASPANYASSSSSSSSSNKQHP